MQRAPFANPDCPRFAISIQAHGHLPRFALRIQEGQRKTVEVTKEAVVSQARKRNGQRARNRLDKTITRHALTALRAIFATAPPRGGQPDGSADARTVR